MTRKGSPNKNKGPCLLAKDAGEIYYFTGKPCVNGHISKRRVVGHNCVECLLERTSDWRQENKDHLKQYSRSYQLQNPEVKRCSESRRNARKRNAEGTFTRKDIEDLYRKQEGLCTICKCDLSIFGYHIDHMDPLSRGGSNWPSNLQLLCPRDNVTKNDLTHAEYLQKLGLIS